MVNSIGLELEDGSNRQGVLKKQSDGRGIRNAVVSFGLAAIVIGALSFSLFFGVSPEISLRSLDTAQQSRQYSQLGKNKCGLKKAPLVVFSFDGFARAYLNQRRMESLEFMAANGVHAEYMLPSFQAKTFPNHYTVATGLYPGYHGIVDAYVFDEKLSSTLADVRKDDAGAFYEYGGEPIWSLFQRLTGGRVACFQFPGCVQYLHNRPYVIDPYAGTERNRYVFDSVIAELLKEDGPRTDFILAYIEEPDHTRHSKKGSSAIIDTVLDQLDQDLNRFFAALQNAGKLACTNIVVLSDHGFMDLSRSVFVPDIVPSSVEHLIPGVVTRIHKNPDLSSEEILRNLFPNPANSTNMGFRAFTRKTLPPRLHFAATERAGDVFLLADPGTLLIDNKPGGLLLSDEFLGSNHGWEYTLPEMRTIFFAMGPDFKANTTIAPFQNVEVFNLFADLLGIEAPQNNGTVGTLWSALKSPNRRVDQFYANNIPISKCSTLTSSSSFFKRAEDGILSLFEDLLPLEVVQSQEKTCYSKIAASFYEIITQSGKAFLRKVSGDVNAAGLAYERDYMSMQEDTKATSKFYTRILAPLAKETNLYKAKFGQMIEIAGWAESHDNWYYYNILIRCEDGQWDSDGWHCEDYQQTRTLAFLIPTDFSDFTFISDRNARELLFEYTARLKDIEAISGLRFFTDSRIPYEASVQMKTNISMSLWD